MLSLLTIIVPLALLDSLNPVTIAVHVYLLGTPQPKTRTTTFMAGVFLAYFAGGLLLAFGLGSILQYIGHVGDTTWRVVQAVLGVALLGFGWYLRGGQSNDEQPAHPASMSARSSFWLGFAVTASDLPTAVPYIAAIERMLQANLSSGVMIGFVTLYNLVYLLPLAALFGVYLLLGDRSVATLQKITAFINRWSGTVLLAFCVVAGVLLLADSIAFVFGKSFL